MVVTDRFHYICVYILSKWDHNWTVGVFERPFLTNPCHHSSYWVATVKYEGYLKQFNFISMTQKKMRNTQTSKRGSETAPTWVLTPATQRHASVIMRVADVLAPNRRQDICSNHADPAMIKEYHGDTCIHIALWPLNKQYLKNFRKSVTRRLLYYWGPFY